MATLVGRDAELARFRALLNDAANGRSVAALVGGDAGVGKSRLVAEVMSIAAYQGFTVLCGQCAEIGDSVPYLPFADAGTGGVTVIRARRGVSRPRERRAHASLRERD